MEWLFVFVVIAAPSDSKKPEQKDDGLPVDIKLPVKHVLSRELRVCMICHFCVNCICVYLNVSKILKFTLLFSLLNVAAIL